MPLQLNFLPGSEEFMKLESSKEETMDILSSYSPLENVELNFIDSEDCNVSIQSIDCNFDDASCGLPAGNCSETTEEESVIYYEHLHLMEIQMKRRPIPNYIEKIQKDITLNMRGIVVDWLVEVAETYKLISDTLYLAVSYLDRYLSLKPVNQQRLQLLGVTCMFIASKYEEISHPDVKEFCYITDNTYSQEDMVKMESDILKVLNFEMGNPTIKTFLRRFIRAEADFDVDTTQEDGCEKSSHNSYLEFLACYLAELSLLDYGCIRFLPSLVAAAVVFLTRFTIQPKMHPWSSTLELYSGYKPSDLKDCVMAIHDLQWSRRKCNLVGIRDKYKQDKFKSVSKWRSPSKIPTAYFDDVEV